jgi:sulfopyruvate decarboxylase TPP-binding subunit
MVTGPEIAAILQSIGISHVVTVPDSTIGQWERDIEAAGIHLIRVCREGEAWTIAGGLFLGGAAPLVLIQCTGLFESGDALRNTLHEWKLPLYAIIGYRSYLNQDHLPGDTSLVFTEPVLAAWRLDVHFARTPGDVGGIATHYRSCQAARIPGVTLLAEGRS